MTEWKTLAGKFTSEQLEVIKEFQKQLGLNENQLIRMAVMFTIFFIRSMIMFAESNIDKGYKKEYRKIKQKVSQYPELKAQVLPFVKNMADSYEQAIKQIVKENEPEIKKFTKKRKAGRPKSQKKKPGRPKDTGI